MSILNDKINQINENIINGKKMLSEAITLKGVDTDVSAPFTIMVENINNLPSGGEDLEGKQKLLDVVIGKKPSLEGVLTLESPLSLFAHHILSIGPMNMVIRDRVKTQLRLNLNESNFKLGFIDAITETVLLENKNEDNTIVFDNVVKNQFSLRNKNLNITFNDMNDTLKLIFK